ncbi:MAG: hypothetical protein NTY07_13815 [Bacteroidia bacterium]|nr:hypothetical protein [Bacteroidia bacterium]
MSKMKTTGILFFLFLLILAGCQKDTTTTTPQPGDKNTSEGSIVISDQTFEVLNGVANSYFTSSGLKAGTLTCPTITASVTTVLPILVTLDWGTGCASTFDGVTRSGKVIASLSGLMSTVGSVATFSFSDFVNDGNKITGTHKITYKGLNAGNNWPRYEVFTEAKIVFPDQKFITYRATYIRLQSEGSATATLDDDVWRIEGSSSGVSREGIAWTASYPSALVKKNSCKWFSSSSVLVTPTGGVPCTINFGDGTCDNKATLKIGDVTTNIEL